MKTVMAPRVKIPAALGVTPALALRPLLVDLGLLVVPVRLEARELAELMTEEREVREDESPELVDEDTDELVLVDKGRDPEEGG